MLFGSLLAGSPVGLKSKRFVFEILFARENRGRGGGKREEKESRPETPGFLSINPLHARPRLTKPSRCPVKIRPIIIV